MCVCVCVYTCIHIALHLHLELASNPGSSPDFCALCNWKALEEPGDKATLNSEMFIRLVWIHGIQFKGAQTYLPTQVIWKSLYGQTSRDHGTLGYFKSLLNRSQVNKDPKRAVDPAIDFLLTVVTGHIIAVAYEILGVTKMDSHIPLSPDLCRSTAQQQYAFVRSIALQLVEKCTLVDGALTRETVSNINDGVYNLHAFFVTMVHLSWSSVMHALRVMEIVCITAGGSSSHTLWHQIVESTHWKRCGCSFKWKQFSPLSWHNTSFGIVSSTQKEV